MIRSTIAAAWRRARSFPWLTMALVTWGITAIGTGVAQADTGIVGFGDLLPRVEVPAGSAPSLFEATNGLGWFLDADPGMGFDQVVVSTMNSIVNVLWGITVLLTQSALYLGQWVLSMSNLPGVNDMLTTSLGTSSTELMNWLAPSALVIGALVAYTQHRGGEGLDQVLWVMVAAVLGLSFVLSPAMWINGTQNLRTIGTDAVLTITSPAAGPAQSKPFEWAPTDYAAATPRDSMIRKANDATFRGLVVYPWCIAEFGSIAGCEKYGTDMVKAGTDLAKRKQVIANVSRAEGGDDKPLTRWLKGYNWPERLVVALAALLVTAVFCGVLLVLAFAAIGSLISTVFHLLIGVIFALIWCIPGRPRQIGLRWLESLIGTVIQGIIAVATYGVTITLLTLIYSNMDALGGVLVVTALAITTVITALGFRSQVSSWFGVMAGGRAGAALLGAAAMRLMMRRGGKSAPAAKAPKDKAPRDADPSDGGRSSRASSPPPRHRPTGGPRPGPKPPRPAPGPGPKAPRGGPSTGGQPGPEPSAGTGGPTAPARRPGRSQPARTGPRPSGGSTPSSRPAPASSPRRPAPAAPSGAGPGGTGTPPPARRPSPRRRGK